MALNILLDALKHPSKGLLVSTQLLIVRYITLWLRVAGDWLHIDAKDARVLAHDRGSEKLGHVFNSLTLKLIAQDLRVRHHGPETSLRIVRFRHRRFQRIRQIRAQAAFSLVVTGHRQRHAQWARAKHRDKIFHISGCDRRHSLYLAPVVLPSIMRS